MKFLRYIFIILIFACSAQNTKKVNKDINFKNEIDIDKFVIKLKAYSNQNPYPDIKN